MMRHKDVRRVLKAIEHTPAETQLAVVRALFDTQYRFVINAPAMLAWIKKNAYLVSVLAGMARRS